jgi:pseudouridine-5'-phosphate glycosidase
MNLHVSETAAQAIKTHRPVVALESTIISHGLPYPINLQTALDCEKIVREQGVTPATIGIWQGIPTIGLTASQIEFLAKESGVFKASRKDLGYLVAKGKTAGTTVSASIHLGYLAGLHFFATGGIGGAHREPVWDISTDLYTLMQTPLLVVSAGAKSILDLPRTLEILESLGVPVIGFRCDEFPAFVVRSSGIKLPLVADSVEELALIWDRHVEFGHPTGMLVVQPVAEELALSSKEYESALLEAENLAEQKKISGAARTPFLLKQIAALTEGKTLAANQSLVKENARLAAQIAFHYENLVRERYTKKKTLPSQKNEEITFYI